MKLNDDDKPKCMSRITFEKHGLIGVDVKSHQKKTTRPLPAITLGNDSQDWNCEIIRRSPDIDDILIQSGKPFAFLTKESRMFPGPTNKVSRGLLRTQLLAKLTTKKTQGRVAKLKDTIYKAHWT